MKKVCPILQKGSNTSTESCALALRTGVPSGTRDIGCQKLPDWL